MKELGWNKPTLFIWEPEPYYHVKFIDCDEREGDIFAPLASEIGKELPMGMKEDGVYSLIRNGEYIIFYGSHKFKDKNEAEARAKCWIYLKEKKII
jgi:hypothetical protein